MCRGHSLPRCHQAQAGGQEPLSLHLTQRWRQRWFQPVGTGDTWATGQGAETSGARHTSAREASNGDDGWGLPGLCRAAQSNVHRAHLRAGLPTPSSEWRGGVGWGTDGVKPGQDVGHTGRDSGGCRRSATKGSGPRAAFQKAGVPAPACPVGQHPSWICICPPIPGSVIIGRWQCFALSGSSHLFIGLLILLLIISLQ